MHTFDVFTDDCRAHAGSTPAIDACNRAIAASTGADRPLLVLLGDVVPSPEAVGILLEAIESDPMIGFATPRLSTSGGNSIARLDLGGDASIEDLPRRVLCELPETYLVADAPARCVLIKPTVLANFGELDRRFRTLEAALWHYVARARRCGFRTLVCNRAVVSFAEAHGARISSSITFGGLPESDRILLRELLPDIDSTRRHFGTGPAAAAETRLARALPDAYGSRPSLLIDVRNVIPGMNGTAIAALGVCGGLHAIAVDWDVTLLASKDGCAFHQLETLFPSWHVSTKLPDRQFAAALRLSQPWHVQEMIDLHSAAAFNLYMFLDTISWDIAYTASGHLDGTWRFLADHADGILFISEFTRDRFVRRFPAAAHTPSFVSHLSFDPADYIHPSVEHGSREDVIFVVGNEYDHKDVSSTVELLTTAFPYQQIVALGRAKAATPRVTLLQSGAISDLEIHRLYAGSRVVVFPSFYEGFGLPILTALAYGRTVIARKSALLDEIAAHCAPRGVLVPFVRRDELVELIGRVLHRQELPSLPLGAAVRNGRPLSWQDIAANVMGFITNLISDLSGSRWSNRQHTIQQLMAAPVSLTEKGVRVPR
jgi:glycosyltransferase involved in cell wall biosynthesis